MTNVSSHTQVHRVPIFPRNRLTAGEVLLWEGRPSSIVYLFQPLALLFLTVVFSAILLISYPSVTALTADVSLWAILIVLLLVMPASTLKMGLLALMAGGAVILLGVVGVLINPALSLTPILIGLIAFLYDYIVWSHTAFAITDRRILTQYGVLNIRFGDTRYDRISNVTVHQTLFERILRYGDLTFSTSGETGGIDSDSPTLRADHRGAVIWENIPRPFEVRKKAEEAILRQTQPTPAHRTISTPTPPSAPVESGPTFSATEAEERLVKLKELRDKGLISQEEYEAKRQEIISKL